MDEIDERLAQLTGGTFEPLHKTTIPKIQRVPILLRNNPDFAKYCTPKIISFGPIHHRSGDLKLGQHYKNIWASRYIEEYGVETHQSSNEASRFLHDIIGDNIVELKKLFNEDVIEAYDDEELTWMLFVDGCSLLYYMYYVDIQRPEALELKLDQLMYSWIDILLLENQLPVRLLELLLRGKHRGNLDLFMSNFIDMGRARRRRELSNEPNAFKATTAHILDYLRSCHISMARTDGDECKQEMMTLPPNGHLSFWKRYKTIRDLKTAGIRIKPNMTRVWERISFTSGLFGGELRLPLFVFRDNSPHLFRNMIAYEMCPDFLNNFECCLYFSFIDSFVDDAEDVKQLRLAGVFVNMIATDQEVATFLNEIGNDLPTKLFMEAFEIKDVAFSKKYLRIKLEIERHYGKKWNRWVAALRTTYFSSPWSFIAFLAALLALVLTFVQTMYSIYPKNK